MMYKAFIGIDVSKDTIDTHVHGKNLHRKVRNSQKGFEELLVWINKYHDLDLYSEVIVCFEHTGMYSLPLAFYLEEMQIPFSMISALEIKRSLGIVRGKSDKVDARRIAEYAFLHRDTLQVTKMPPKTILTLHSTLTLRSRLVRHRAGYMATKTEQKRFLEGLDLKSMQAIHRKMIRMLDTRIKEADAEIRQLIGQEETLKKTFKLVTSVKGVGLITGAYFIVYTHNFTRFTTWRKFACYCGIVPFEHQSGKMQKRSRVSQLANKQMKRILHMAAMAARRHDKELKAYYNRRLDDGKEKMEVLNVIRNKLVARAFAVVKRGTPYVELHQYEMA